MYKAAVRWQVRRAVRLLNAGNPAAQIKAYAADAKLVFPGVSSWSGEYKGREAIAEFMRFVAAEHLQFGVEDILVNGPPWQARACVICTVTAADRAGKTVYSNRGALYVKARWGKIVFQEDFEDTHESERFDAYVTARDAAPNQD
ncbi:MAG TPA: nuclear transport factor 2 family protein [Frankiaceae bacterium]|jgi:ketosteroid isomerase-like protein|nr:nuclear transport factor 2 family protein [Frankiaceae bacterium]